VTNQASGREILWGKPPPAGDLPIVVAISRGGQRESRHAVACAVVDADGAPVARWGDVNGAVFPRSAIKMIQSLPLIESGAAGHYECSDVELALSCASHGGEPRHVTAVAAWLDRIGGAPGDLACGARWPLNQDAARALAAGGGAPTKLHNNCSGEHTGMLATARWLDERIEGYEKPDHPVQRRIADAIGSMCGVDVTTALQAIDGCSAPAIALPLSAIALGLARFGAPTRLPPGRSAACRHLLDAMRAQPFMVAGSGRFCTALATGSAGRLIGKTGAEGVYAVAVPGRGLGIAVKVHDGAGRAAEVAVAAVLDQLGLLDDATRTAIAAVAKPVLTNWAGIEVGAIGVEPGF
jgi:L-asparaginase II